MNRNFLLTGVLLSSGILLHAQPLNQELLTKLTQPVTFTRSGFENFFVDVFNSPAYTEHVLHSYFGHVLNFLHYGSQLENPYDFITTVLEIFHTRMHDCLWVDARAFSHVVGKFPDYFEHLCQQSDEVLFEQEVQKLLQTTFIKQYTKHTSRKALTSFDHFIEMSTDMIAPLSKDIVRLADYQFHNQPVRGLQDAIARFVENGVQKLIWDPTYPQDSWKVFHRLAHQITVMQYTGLISNPQRANQLYWALLYRYGYFLKSMKEQLATEFFETIKHDLLNGAYPWLEVPEQEEFLISKLSYLKHILWECAFDLNVQRSKHF